MSEDYTFCGNDCSNKDCFRNQINIKFINMPHSFAFLKDTVDCEGFKEPDLTIKY